MAGRKVSDFRGRYAGGDPSETMQRINQRRQQQKPTGVNMGSVGGKSVIESERQGQNERLSQYKSAWAQGHPRG